MVFSLLANSLDVEKFIRNITCVAIPVYCIIHWLGRAVTHLKDYFGTVAKVEKEASVLFKEQVISGAKKLCERGIKGSVNLNGFNCLISAMFVENSNLEIFCHVRESETKCIPFKIPSDKCKERMLYGVLGDPKDGFGAVKYLLGLNKDRQEQGIIPISKLFIPFTCEGAVAHGILVVIEIDSNKNVNITVINSMGENTPYSSSEEKLTASIKQAFPLSYQISEVVHNKVHQQTDVYSCGFQQVRNIQDCQGLDSIYDHVRAGKLSTEKRDLYSMEQWFEDEIRPKITSFK